MNTLWDNIFKARPQKADEVERIVMQIPVFQELNTRELKIIRRILYQREYKNGEVIFSQGDAGLGMYIVLKGTVSIRCDPDNHQLAELREGDFFGELALLDDSPRSATAVSTTPSTVLCFFKPELLDILSRYPRTGCKILFRLAWTIGERLKGMNEQILTLKCAREEGHNTGQ